MDTSFYTAVRGTMTQQTHMDILSNNIANLNTNGYRTKNASFLDLMYYGLRGLDEDMQAGTGATVRQTDTDFSGAALLRTEQEFDFAINGYGFFMIQNPVDGSITYTRSGSFALSERADGMYLADSLGNLVMDAQQNPIRYVNGELTALPGMFDFVHTNGMISVGDNYFIPADKNGAVMPAGNATLVQGVLENSNVDLADQMTKVIISQRAYSYMLRMVQTADEVEQTINGLRG